MTSAFLLDGSATLAAAANEVWVEQKATQSTKYNALWKDGPGLVPTSDAAVADCFRVEVLEGSSVWVGMTDEAHLGQGWKTKALEYGGNLSDGGGLMRSSFGPSLKAGMSVDMRTELLPEGGDKFSLSMHLAHDGNGLGEAFNLKSLDATIIGALFPLIAFSSGPAKARISRVTPCPPASAFARPGASPRKSVVGKWAVAASALVDEPPPPDMLSQVVFNVHDEPWSISAHVANNLRASLDPGPPHAVAGGVMATMMMPPPPLQALEKTVSEIIGSITSVELKSDSAEGELHIAHAHGTLTLRPHMTTHTPVSRDQVSWL